MPEPIPFPASTTSDRAVQREERSALTRAVQTTTTTTSKKTQSDRRLITVGILERLGVNGIDQLMIDYHLNALWYAMQETLIAFEVGAIEKTPARYFVGTLRKNPGGVPDNLDFLDDWPDPPRRQPLRIVPAEEGGE